MTPDKNAKPPPSVQILYVATSKVQSRLMGQMVAVSYQ